MPEVSVIVPVYKVEPYIRRCVDSILNQTFTDFELILVDDGSPDNCGAICDEYATKDSRVRVIHKENGGAASARNVGIDWVYANSNSDWLSFIDSDDYIHPCYLETLYRAAVDHQVDVSICSLIETNGEPIDKSFIDSATLYDTETLWCEKQLACTIPCVKIYRRNAFAGIRYPEGVICEDEFTTYKALFRCQKLAYVDAPLYAYYQSPNSVMRSEWTPRRLVAVDALEERAEFFRQSGFEKAYIYDVKLLIGILQYNIGIMRSYGGKYELICREYTERYERCLKSCFEDLPLKDKIDVRLMPFRELHRFYAFWRCLFEKGPLYALERTKERIRK